MLTECSPAFFRARVATESASSRPTSCRGSVQERECGESSRVSPVAEKEDTWLWRSPRYTNIINPCFFSLVCFCLFPELHWNHSSPCLVSDDTVRSICGSDFPVQSCRGLGKRPGTSWGGHDQRTGAKMISVSECLLRVSLFWSNLFVI